MRSKAVRAVVSGSLVALGIGMTTRFGQAKGFPDEIVIFGPHLTKPIEITDRATLQSFSPWIGEFIDWNRGALAAQPACAAAYDVRFYQKWAGRRSDLDRGPLKFIFEFTYCPAASRPGLVKLPGPGDRFYDDNAATITRSGKDGHWFRASRQWDSLVSRTVLR